MTISKVNNYLPGQNLTNLAANVNYNALGVEKTNISVSFTASPATVTVAIGSIWELNGNTYVVESSTAVFAMASAAHNYITYNETSGFSSASTVGTWDAAKQGFYQADGITRTLVWYIAQTDEFYNRSLNLLEGQTQDISFSDSIQLATNFQQFNQIKVFTGTLDGSGTALFDSGLSALENYIVLDVAWYQSATDSFWQSPGSEKTTGTVGFIFARLFDSTAATYANYIGIEAGSTAYSKNYRVVIAKVFN